ncbi:DUF47 domain-containing protein [Ferrimonas lipolytica]|uniref:DUF47 family protein n=1 Tax=Ferrimonas lipolytica TaxID=2724191 RepID=A0A6H1UFP7_9GAMM|nr:DUF47 family protein [Ferrimonas lipolytica]QIZ77449.1 DUF47 family protein [Ferrimonas lipolytica]
MWFTKAQSLFSQSKTTESHIFQFFDCVTAAHHQFMQLWQIYLTQGAQCADFDQTLASLSQIESKADDLQRQIDARLYGGTLIPDLRADVALLIDQADKLINLQETIGIHLKVEQPTVPSEVHPSLLAQIQIVGDTLDHTVLCAKSFLTDLQRVQEYHQKVILFESDANSMCIKAKTILFSSDLELTHKVQLRYFFDRIDAVANLAEDISDRISIFTLKRLQ